ncbi:MAG: hypothetical protein NTY11_01490 [Candidatus Parcubacteria bacterium]|nr:hypothetical protein [Candidatus Parcubacteria bacterium]
MEDIILSENVQNIINNFKRGGVEKLHVLADFDQTITKSFINGRHIPSIISILRDEGYLTSDYPIKAKILYAKYHPIEIDPKIPTEEKKRFMEEWWTTHFKLLIESKLNKKDIEDIANSDNLVLREGTKEFFDNCFNHNIPIIIFTSCGVGGDPVRIFLKKQGIFYENVYIISNDLIWDKNGFAIDFKKPIIHGMNKNETFIKDFPVFEKIKNRNNVLLLGNSLGDIGMITGFEYNNLLKIGFLNENEEESKEYFKESYDVVILNDGTMSCVNKFLKEIIS